MRKRQSRRWLALLVCCGLTVLVTGCGALPPALAGGSAPAPPTPTDRPVAGRPVRLRIPSIGLDWPVIPVGRDVTGAMDTPQGPESAASWHEGFWWKYGYLAGQPGNTVIAGHVDDVRGNLTSFAQVTQLAPGDDIYVTTDRGQTLRFTVTRLATIPNPVGGPNDPAIASIFGSASTPNLNLITCTGDWVGNEFDQRLVVYSTLAQGSGA